jgi:hypothetical protein
MIRRLCGRTELSTWGFLAAALATGCKTDTTAPGEVSVAISPTSASLVAGGSQELAATVLNDPAAKGVTWSITGCTGGAAGCGALTNITSTTATYTAPTPVPADARLGVTATSLADNTKFSTVTLTLAAVGVTLLPSSVNLVAGEGQDLTATILNDPGAEGVTWSITGCTGGEAACGSLSNVTSNSATYLAPATVPPTPLGVTATAVADPTKGASAVVVVVRPPSAITVAVQPASLILGPWGPGHTRAQATIKAYVDNDPESLGVVWSALWGSISPATSASGAGVVYTAPWPVECAFVTVVQASSLADPSRRAFIRVTVRGYFGC